MSMANVRLDFDHGDFGFEPSETSVVQMFIMIPSVLYIYSVHLEQYNVWW